jgi:hypothetical protein
MPFDGSLAMQSLVAFDRTARLRTLCSAKIPPRVAISRKGLSELTGCEAHLAVLDLSHCSSSRWTREIIGDGVPG